MGGTTGAVGQAEVVSWFHEVRRGRGGATGQRHSGGGMGSRRTLLRCTCSWQAATPVEVSSSLSQTR